MLCFCCVYFVYFVMLRHRLSPNFVAERRAGMHPSLSSTTIMDFYDRSEYPSHSPPPGPQLPAPHGWFIDSLGLCLGTGPCVLLPSIMVTGGYSCSEVSWEPFQEGGGPGYPFTHPLIPPSPSPTPSIPLQISAEGIDNSDVSLLLASIAELPFPTAFKTLLASSMALWVASASDVTTVRSLGLDTAINGFLSFIGPFPPTLICLAPLPVDIPPTPHFSASPLPPPPPSDEDALMADTSSSHLRTPMPRPLEKGKMRALKPSKVPVVLAPAPVIPSLLPAPPAAPPSCVPISDHARDQAQPSVAQMRNGKTASFAAVAAQAASKPGPPKPPLGPKADLAQRQSHDAPTPAWPSLMLSLTHHTLVSTLRAKAALAPPVLVDACNVALSADPAHANVLLEMHPRGTSLERYHI